MQKQENEIKLLDREELKKERQGVLVEQNPKAITALQLVLLALMASGKNIPAQSFSENAIGL